MSGHRAEVVCVGAITADALAFVTDYPHADERVIAQEVMFAGGGPAATAAVVLARQGVDVAFVGRVGQDAAGDQALEQLRAEGVDVSLVERDAQVPTQASCIVVSHNTQTRAISTLSVPPLAELSRAANALLDNTSWVHTDQAGFSAVAACLDDLTHRPLLSIDAGNPVPGLRLDAVDLFVPTVESLARVMNLPNADPPTAAKAALAQGPRAVVATDGSRGAHAWWTGALLPHQPSDAGEAFASAASGVAIKSTLGAGDVFHGALLAALVREESWEQALRSANATAALSCRALDGRSAIPTLGELSAFLADGNATL